MEKELFFSGYCRQLDNARMVEVIVKDGEVTEADCGYGSCVHKLTCPIAMQIEEAKRT